MSAAVLRADNQLADVQEVDLSMHADRPENVPPCGARLRSQGGVCQVVERGLLTDASMIHGVNQLTVRRASV